MEKENEKKVSETKVNETKVETKEEVKKEIKKDNQNNKVLIVLAVILSILVLGLGGFIVYDKVLSDKPIDNKDNNNGNNNNDNKTDNDDKQDDNTKNDNKTDDKNTGGTTNTDCPTGNQYKYNVSKRKQTQVIQTRYFQVIVDTAGDAYVSVVGYPNFDDDKNNLIKFEKTFKEYAPEGTWYFDPGEPDTISAYKLNVGKILSVSYVDVGNGGTGGYIFIKENGTLSFFLDNSIFGSGNIEVKNIEGIKNVVSIQQATASAPVYAVTIDGEEIDLWDYLFK